MVSHRVKGGWGYGICVRRKRQWVCFAIAGEGGGRGGSSEMECSCCFWTASALLCSADGLVLQEEPAHNSSLVNWEGFAEVNCVLCDERTWAALESQLCASAEHRHRRSSRGGAVQRGACLAAGWVMVGTESFR
jgi:hypothetical protein